MKTFKKIISLALVAVLALTLCACHGKDEVAVTVNDMDIPAGLYLTALVDADLEARQRVDEQLADSKDESKENTETDYYAQSIDGSSFVDYVKYKALQRCKEFAFYQGLADKGTIKLTDEEVKNAHNTAESYWGYYGYSYLYGPNGVSLDTFKKMMVYSSYSNAYFKYVYGEGGEKEVSKETIKEHMMDNYVTAYVLSASYKEKATEDDKADLKNKLEGYGKRLQKGESYVKIYNELNGTEEKEAEVSKDGPKNPYASILVDSDYTSSSASSTKDFATIFEDVKNGNYIVIENEDKTGLTLYLKLDAIETDGYYLTNLTDEILVELKQDEFEKSVKEKIADYEVKENSWAIKRFNVKKIDYSEYEAYYAAMNSSNAG